MSNEVKPSGAINIRSLFNTDGILPKLGKCFLFDAFSYITQLSLVLISFSVLICKRYRESPRRTWKIWALDVAKQICSVTLEHIVNLGISVFLSSKTSADECTWYFINCFTDATVGVLLCLAMMKAINLIVANCNWHSLKSGLYYTVLRENDAIFYVINAKTYLAQLFLWLGVIIISQSGLLVLNVLGMKWLEKVGNFLLKPFLFNEKLELVMVMIVCPLVFNAVQFWIFDNLLKLSSSESANANEAAANALVDNTDDFDRSKKAKRIELVESPKKKDEAPSDHIDNDSNIITAFNITKSNDETTSTAHIFKEPASPQNQPLSS